MTRSSVPNLTAILERLEAVQHTVFAAGEVVLAQHGGHKDQLGNKLLFGAHCALSLAEEEIGRIALELSGRREQA